MLNYQIHMAIQVVLPEGLHRPIFALITTRMNVLFEMRLFITYFARVAITDRFGGLLK